MKAYRGITAPTPYSLLPTPYSLLPTPYSLNKIILSLAFSTYPVSIEVLRLYT
ncbi:MULTISPECIES: hypothetical protein [unclassified Moorena]|uniref:hypothetical protein n=1 Tax=unclassified Moorena TaxID=2683338 RepID=UPI0013CCB712|nr:MULTISPECIES: hypothetical protein [unclassified Moorena]NEO18043.1 hypothetical protein [Moorena sp. SIO4A5]NEQ58270.1 hypothetical protein [Moorena sp. SIO4A1]